MINQAMPSEIAVYTPVSHGNMTPNDAGTPVEIPRDDGGRRQQELLDHNSRDINEVLKGILKVQYCSHAYWGSRRWGYDGARFAFRHRYRESALSLRNESAKIAGWRGKSCRAA